MRPPLPSIAYAKNPRHERFVQTFDGKVKGRYMLGFLAAVQYVGGAELRQSIERELGNPRYQVNDWCDAQDLVLIFDRSLRAGVAADRLGETVVPTFKRSRPELFEGKTLLQGFAALEQGYRMDTSYGGISPGQEVAPGCIRLFRSGSPAPCAFFVGVVRGMLSTFRLEGTVREVTCEWEGSDRCTFEARWSPDIPEPRLPGPASGAG